MEIGGVSLILIAVVAFGFIFDFTNGFHDSANAIATSVSTRAMSPRVAVAIAAVLNFLGAFVSLKVAATVAKGIVDPSAVTLTLLLTGLVGTIAWNLITWYLGLPTSSSHSLIGGMIGSVGVATAFGGVQWGGILDKVVIPSGIAPFAGLAIGAVLAIVVTWLAKGMTPSFANKFFRRLQILSGSFVAFTHGQNDAQKTMGLIALALVAGGELSSSKFEVPLWVIICAATAISAGTYVGGWRIIRTLGTRFYRIHPIHGFTSQFASAAVILGASLAGGPVSTTQVVSMSILGAGAAERKSKVRWSALNDIVVAWVLTLPATALLAMPIYYLIESMLRSGGR